MFYYKVHNWNGLAIGPCAMFAALLPEYPGNAGRLAESLRIVKRWLDASIDEKGGFLEGPHYLSYGGDRVFLMAWILRDRGGEDLFRLPKIQKLPAMMIQKLIPGTMFMDFRNDSDYRKPDCAALMLAAGLRDPAAAWLWKHGRHNGDFPLTALFARHLPKAEINFADYPAGVFFPQRQFALWRTGWSADDTLFSIECGPFTYTPSGELNTHRHADKGHFSVFTHSATNGRSTAVMPTTGRTKKTAAGSGSPTVLSPSTVSVKFRGLTSERKTHSAPTLSTTGVSELYAPI